MTELEVLQAIRLKGRVSRADLSTTLNGDADVVDQCVDTLITSGLLSEAKTIRLTPEGRGALTELLTEERSDADADAIASAYSQFRTVNAEFKTLISDWQVRDGEPNDHGDSAYDSTVLVRLGPVHTRVTAIISEVAIQLPRLDNYQTKLDSALRRVLAGDIAWLTRPTIDSYHTVWFELHEELILAAGLTREEEAKAGHAQ